MKVAWKRSKVNPVEPDHNGGTPLIIASPLLHPGTPASTKENHSVNQSDDLHFVLAETILFSNDRGRPGLAIMIHA